MFVRAAIIGLLLAASSCAGPTVPEILKKIEVIQTQKSDVFAQVSLTQQKPSQGVKKTEAMYYRRDKDNAFLIILTAPESEKGNGYLRVGENFWMYRKNTRTFQHINRDENIGGSDARGDDFENRKLTELYAPPKDTSGKNPVTEEMLGKIPVYKFEVRAIVKDVDYPKKIYWVRTDNFLPLKEEAYSSSGTLMQSAYYINYSIIDGNYVAVKSMYVDEFEKGNKTIMEIADIKTAKVDDQIFTKAYLESLSK